MNFIIFILLGALAGWLAGKIMKGSGFGFLWNVLLGIGGAVVGGWLFDFVGINADGTIGSIITAVIGAIVVLAGR